MTVHRDLPRTLLPLDRWAQIVGLDPRHFRQVTTTKKPVTSCTKVWKQYSWQESDQVGRYDVADAIQQAEKIFAQYLGYKLLPTWEYAERQRTPKPATPELYHASTYDPTGYRLAVQANWAHFVESGLETKSLVVAATDIDWSDEDTDGYFETATITCTAVDAWGSAITNEDELAVYYPGESGADAWEIRPLQSVSISGGIATIKMWRHQLGLPDLIEALEPEAIDGDDDDVFLTTVDVYRHYNNTATQCTLIWGDNLYNCGSCGTSTGCCEVCGQMTQTGCLMPKDYRRGWLTYRAAEYDSDEDEWSSACLTCGRNPDQLLLYYRAGLQDMSKTYPKIQMSPQWERAVAFYALALLDRPVCDCAPIKGISNKWREDLMKNTSFQTGVLNNPLGTTRAAQFAWNMINEPGRRVTSPVKY